jgi:uncharacterized protein YozE (UPF0346 family)
MAYNIPTFTGRGTIAEISTVYEPVKAKFMNFSHTPCEGDKESQDLAIINAFLGQKDAYLLLAQQFDTMWDTYEPVIKTANERVSLVHRTRAELLHATKHSSSEEARTLIDRLEEVEKYKPQEKLALNNYIRAALQEVPAIQTQATNKSSLHAQIDALEIAQHDAIQNNYVEAHDEAVERLHEAYERVTEILFQIPRITRFQKGGNYNLERNAKAFIKSLENVRADAIEYGFTTTHYNGASSSVISKHSGYPITPLPDSAPLHKRCLRSASIALTNFFDGPRKGVTHGTVLSDRRIHKAVNK